MKEQSSAVKSVVITKITRGTVQCQCRKCGSVWAQPNYYKKFICVRCQANTTDIQRMT